MTKSEQHTFGQPVKELKNMIRKIKGKGPEPRQIEYGQHVLYIFTR